MASRRTDLVLSVTRGHQIKPHSGHGGAAVASALGVPAVTARELPGGREPGGGSAHACSYLGGGPHLSLFISAAPATRSARLACYAWQARPDVLVATRGGIEAAMCTYASRATAMSCDASLPPVQVVHPRTTVRQRCYFKPTGANPDWGARSRNGGKTVAVQITIDDSKIGLDVVTQ